MKVAKEPPKFDHITTDRNSYIRVEFKDDELPYNFLKKESEDESITRDSRLRDES